MKHSINISLVKSESNLSPIRIRVSCDCKRIDLRPGISYNVDKWNSKTQRPKNNTWSDNHQSAAEINTEINKAVDMIENYFSVCDINNVEPSLSELKEQFNSKFQSKNEIDEQSNIIDLYNEFMNSSKNDKSWAYNTIRKYKTLKNLLVKYNITEISESSLQIFVNKEIENENRNPTISKNLRLIKMFGKWLYKKGVSTYNVDDFKPRLKGSERNKKAEIYLTLDELMKFYNFDFSSKPHLATVRDVFCFCCFSGLRYSDARKLEKNDISDGIINVVTQKTDDPLRIELNKYTTEILQRYSKFGKFALPVISNQKTNKELKQAAKICGLDAPIRKVFFVGSDRKEIVKPKYEVLSFHAARRTFVVQCLTRGIPSEVIMKWTGHKDFKAMQPYMDIVDSLKKSEMSKFDLD